MANRDSGPVFCTHTQCYWAIPSTDSCSSMRVSSGFVISGQFNSSHLPAKVSPENHSFPRRISQIYFFKITATIPPPKREPRTKPIMRNNAIGSMVSWYHIIPFSKNFLIIISLKVGAAFFQSILFRISFTFFFW